MPRRDRGAYWGLQQLLDLVVDKSDHLTRVVALAITLVITIKLIEWADRWGPA